MTQVDSAPPPQANPPVRRTGGPRIPGPLETVVLFWRWLRRMKTALYLLAAVGVLTVIATLVPQEPNVPTTVRAWRAGTEGPGRLVSGLIDAIGGYDVFGSPIFLVTLALLFISLTACLIPRYRAWWRLVRRSRPPRARVLERQPYVRVLTTSARPEEAHDVARSVLGRRWRLRDEDPGLAPQVAAERGHVLREGGSLLFHTSFYLLLVGIIVGQLVSFSGQVGIVEGDRWSETAVGYWSYNDGRLWDAGDHRGFELALDKFDVDWHRDPQFGGQPKVFLSHVTITRPDGTSFSDTVGGNDPLVVDGMKIHQLDWGYAPRVVIFQDGEVVHDELLTLGATEQGFWRGAAKAPAAEPQDIGLDLFFYPYAPERENGPVPTGAPWADAPLLAFDDYRGDLRLDRTQNVNSLDTTGMELRNQTFLRPGEVVDLGDGVAVAFPELRRWVGFQVSRRPTVPLLLVASGLILMGLVSSLYAYRRRVWVQAIETEGGTTVTVAGRTFQRPQAFEPEFDDVVTRLGDRLPPAGGAAHRDPAAPTPTEVVRG